MPLLSAEERLGTVLAKKYRLTRVLGEGGMGVVFEGFDLRFDLKVAVKFLHAQYARDEDVTRRFFNEAKAAAKLSDDHVVAVKDFDVDPVDGSPYIVLEFLDGKSLGETLLERGTLSPAEAWEVLSPLMDVLQHAHEQGIIHRDLKPDNLHLSLNRKKRVVPKVLDFGVAKLIEGTSASQTKTIVGTPTYMAPEQARATDVGPWSDVWSMGVIWFEVLSGRLHHDFPPDIGTMGIIVQIMSHDPLRLADVEPDIDPALAAIVQAALVRDRKHRFGSMREFHDALSRYFLGGVPLREPTDRTVLDRRSEVPETAKPEDVHRPFKSIDPLASTGVVEAIKLEKPVPSTPLGTIPGLKKMPLRWVGAAGGVALVGALIAFALQTPSESQTATVLEAPSTPATALNATGAEVAPSVAAPGVDAPSVVVQSALPSVATTPAQTREPVAPEPRTPRRPTPQRPTAPPVEESIPRGVDVPPAQPQVRTRRERSGNEVPIED